MKFIVDELPYCGEPCFFEETRCDANWLNICPSTLGKKIRFAVRVGKNAVSY